MANYCRAGIKSLRGTKGKQVYNIKYLPQR
jgi:hypothetical protein